ncbi:hypothetical protein JHK86_024817 [Glycine max]|nr:hypothetical protein JHK86_024817 [Glycine max]
MGARVTVVETSKNNDGVLTTDVDILSNNVGGEPATDVERKPNKYGCSAYLTLKWTTTTTGLRVPDVEMDPNNDGLFNMCVVLCVLACWGEDSKGDAFKKYLARILDYLWVSEDGMTMQASSTVKMFKYLFHFCPLLRPVLP